MMLDLVRHERRFGKFQGAGEKRSGKIGNADMAREPVALRTIQRPDAGLERHRRVRPVDEQEVDLIEPERVQALLRGTAKIRRADVGPPHLGRHEDRIAGHAGGAQALADFPFVGIHGRGIEMAIAGFERCADETDALFALEGPGAEPDGGDLGAICFDDLHSSSFPS